MHVATFYSCFITWFKTLWYTGKFGQFFESCTWLSCLLWRCANEFHVEVWNISPKFLVLNIIMYISVHVPAFQTFKPCLHLSPIHKNFKKCYEKRSTVTRPVKIQWHFHSSFSSKKTLKKYFRTRNQVYRKDDDDFWAFYRWVSNIPIFQLFIDLHQHYERKDRTQTFLFKYTWEPCPW